MQTVHSETTWGFSADKASSDRLRASFGGTFTQENAAEDHKSLPSGWWLLPCVVLGAGFWVWAISALVS